jgi:hypothetical protein
MAKTAKVTDLTKLEGDPDPGRADIQNPRMHLEVHARASWQAGFLTFVARCSERSPVARAITVSILMVIGMALAAVLHLVLAGLLAGWLTALISVVSVFIPAAVYGILTREKGMP